ncbi:MAG: hypothetical protein U1E53_26810 [Dongiaceae bacterium]
MTYGRPRIALPRMRALGLSLVLLAGAAAPALAFDAAGYQTRLEATQADVAGKTLANPDATLARLDEMIEIGIAAAREYAAKEPKYAKLMEAVIANASDMKTYSETQLEEIWGEEGSGGDAVGFKLSSIGAEDPPRNVMELIVAPSMAAILVRKWETTQRAKWLAQAGDELKELSEHLEKTK